MRGIRGTSGRWRRDADPVGLRDTIGSTDLQNEAKIMNLFNGRPSPKVSAASISHTTSDSRIVDWHNEAKIMNLFNGRPLAKG